MEHLLRVVQLGKNPTKGSLKGSLSRVDAVPEAQGADQGADQGAVLQLLHTRYSSAQLTEGSAMRSSHIYETVAMTEAGSTHPITSNCC